MFKTDDNTVFEISVNKKKKKNEINKLFETAAIIQLCI